MADIVMTEANELEKHKRRLEVDQEYNHEINKRQAIQAE